MSNRFRRWWRNAGTAFTDQLMTRYLTYRITLHTEAIALHPMLLNLTAGVNYVATAQQVRRIRQVEPQLGAPLIATIERHTLPNLWQGEPLDGKRVGYLSPPHLGDALCHTAAVAALRRHYPTSAITVYAEPPSTECWFDNRDIQGTYAKPCLYCVPEAVIASYDYWIAPAPLPYLRRGSATNYYDLLEESHGLSIDIKHPYVWTSPQVRESLGKQLVETDYSRPEPTELRLLNHPFILVQTTASEESRTPQDWYDRMMAISARLPHCWYMVIGDLDMMPGFEEQILAQPRRGWLLKYMLCTGTTRLPLAKPLRAFDILELARRASAVVSCDSLSLHAAAAWGCPTLALFNDRALPSERIPPPESRIATYAACEAVSMHAPHEEVAERVQSIIRY